jgi:uncharacterized protein YeaC (DUF1315 family)
MLGPNWCSSNATDDYTPSMPMIAADGSALPSYRTCTSILYAMPHYTPDMWGPARVSLRDTAYVQANRLQQNMRQALKGADQALIAPVQARVAGLEDEILEMVEEHDDVVQQLTAMTLERNNPTVNLTAMTMERDNLTGNLMTATHSQRLTAATTAIGHWPNGNSNGNENRPQSLEYQLRQRQDQFRTVISQDSGSSHGARSQESP